MAYRNVPVPQGDGSRYQWLNCVCAVVADLIDRATLGHLRFSGADVRFETGDRTGGLDYYQAVMVADKMTGGRVKLRAMLGADISDIRDGVAGGAPMGVSVLMPYGGHTVYVIGYYWTDRCQCERDLRDGVAHGEYTIDDPGTTKQGYVRWSAQKLYSKARARTGSLLVNLLAGEDTEGVNRAARRDGFLRSQPSMGAPTVASIRRGAGLRLQRTTNGGTWKRPNGTFADGWFYGTVSTSSKAGWGRGDIAA